MLIKNLLKLIYRLKVQRGLRAMKDLRLTTEEKIYFILGFIMWAIVSSLDYNLMMLCR